MSPLPAVTQGSGSFVMLPSSRGEERQEVPSDTYQLSPEEDFTFTALWSGETFGPAWVLVGWELSGSSTLGQGAQSWSACHRCHALACHSKGLVFIV